jgi:hypothetical protein
MCQSLQECKGLTYNNLRLQTALEFMFLRLNTVRFAFTLFRNRTIDPGPPEPFPFASLGDVFQCRPELP